MIAEANSKKKKDSRPEVCAAALLFFCLTIAPCSVRAQGSMEDEALTDCRQEKSDLEIKLSEQEEETKRETRRANANRDLLHETARELKDQIRKTAAAQAQVDVFREKALKLNELLIAETRRANANRDLLQEIDRKYKDQITATDVALKRLEEYKESFETCENSRNSKEGLAKECETTIKKKESEISGLEDELKVSVARVRELERYIQDLRKPD